MLSVSFRKQTISSVTLTEQEVLPVASLRCVFKTLLWSDFVA